MTFRMVSEVSFRTPTDSGRPKRSGSRVSSTRCGIVPIALVMGVPTCGPEYGGRQLSIVVQDLFRALPPRPRERRKDSADFPVRRAQSWAQGMSKSPLE